MTPPERPPTRPSVPHSMTRVPTKPQPQVPIYDARQEQSGEEPEDELLTVARRISGDGWSPEDLISFGFIILRRLVVETRNDVALKTTAQQGLDQSKTIMSLTGEVRRARIMIGVLIGIASGVGGVAGTCGRDAQETKVEVLEPIAVVEEKAERAEKKAKEVELTTEERLDAMDKRVTDVEDALGDVTKALKDNTDAVLGIAAKLGVQPASSKKKP